MAITVANANAYFLPTSHTMAKVWAAFSGDQKTGAIAMAKRLLARTLGREVVETASLITDAVREDLATYEQALYLLRNSPAAVEGQTGVAGYVANDQGNPEGDRDIDPGIIAPMARRYLTAGRLNGAPAPMVELFRG